MRGGPGARSVVTRATSQSGWFYLELKFGKEVLFVTSSGAE
jgi:hypothetical protein